MEKAMNEIKIKLGILNFEKVNVFEADRSQNEQFEKYLRTCLLVENEIY